MWNYVLLLQTTTRQAFATRLTLSSYAPRSPLLQGACPWLSWQTLLCSRGARRWRAPSGWCRRTRAGGLRWCTETLVGEGGWLGGQTGVCSDALVRMPPHSICALMKPMHAQMLS